MIFNDAGVMFADVSFWQDNNTTPQRIDFTKMAGAGGVGVIVRAGQNIWIDDDFTYNWQKSREAGLPRGAYWFYDSRADPVVQAEMFAGLFANDKPEMGLWLDLEERYGGAWGGYSNWKKFIIRLQQLMPNTMIGIYTGYYYIKDKIPVAEYPFFAKLKLWLAWYTNDVAVVQVPAPWKTVEFWQWGTPAWGVAWGCESPTIDMNKYNGTLEQFKNEYGGVETDGYKQIRRYDSNIHIWRGRASARVTNNDGDLIKPSNFAASGAKVIINGDGWDKLAPAPHKPLSLAMSDGSWVQSSQYDYRPFINWRSDGSVIISGTAKAGARNLVSGTRFSVKAGVNALASSTSPEHLTERNPRTAIGYTSDGRMIACVVDGRSTISRGVTLYELADIMISEGAWYALELDGGDSSIMLMDGVKKSHNGDLINGVRVERATVNSILLFKGVTNMANGKAQELKGNNASVRAAPDVSGAKVGSLLPYATIEFMELVNGSKVATDKWLRLPNGIHYVNQNVAGVEYFKIISMPTTTPPSSAGDVSIDMTLKADGTIVGIWKNI